MALRGDVALALNGMIYLAYGIASGHLRRRMFPLAPRAMLNDVLNALRGRLAHDDLSVYNSAQKAAYLAAILLATGLVLSGLAIWKPVQFYALASLMGDYEGARLLHFFCMAGLVLFVLVHVAMVLLVPRTFLTMITGKLKNG
jgi:thiosulfate reductase cytochrome b subunit